VDSSESSADPAAALAAFAECIKDAGTRQSLASGGAPELQQAGVNTDALPSDVVDLLAGLDQEQLELLAEIGETLVAAGFYVSLGGGGRLYYL
jgi:hypothetical protein